MTLDEWLSGPGAEAGWTTVAFAAAVGVHRTVVSEWRYLRAMPGARSMVRVAQVTGGAVMPNDFFPSLVDLAAGGASGGGKISRNEMAAAPVVA